jgi:hypothetical protein
MITLARPLPTAGKTPRAGEEELVRFECTIVNSWRETRVSR